MAIGTLGGSVKCRAIPAIWRHAMGAGNARVLTADDDRDTADSTADLLRLDGHDVMAVYDGQQAVETARTFWPHVVILDINMSRLNGYEAAAALRKQETADHHFILIAHTARAEPADVKRAQGAGFDHHVAKPHQSRRLRTLVRASLGRLPKHRT